MAERPSRETLTLMVQHRGLKSLIAENRAFRRFLWTLFVDAGIFYPSYSRRSPYDTAYQEGRRAMGLEVLHMLKNLEPRILSVLEAEGNLLAQELKMAGKPSPTEELDHELSQHDDEDRFDAADGSGGGPAVS